MSDDRWNSNDERAPYIDRRPISCVVRPAKRQPFWNDGNRYVQSEEIFAFIEREFGDEKRQARESRRRVIQPPRIEATRERDAEREAELDPAEDWER